MSKPMEPFQRIDRCPPGLPETDALVQSDVMSDARRHDAVRLARHRGRKAIWKASSSRLIRHRSPLQYGPPTQSREVPETDHGHPPGR